MLINPHKVNFLKFYLQTIFLYGILILPVRTGPFFNLRTIRVYGLSKKRRTHAHRSEWIGIRHHDRSISGRLRHSLLGGKTDALK